MHVASVYLNRNSYLDLKWIEMQKCIVVGKIKKQLAFFLFFFLNEISRIVKFRESGATLVDVVGLGMGRRGMGS